MRLLRVFSLLFSLGQFLLILKLIELVRGSDIASPEPQPVGRSFFLGQLKNSSKKYKQWGGGSNSSTTAPPEESANTTNATGLLEDDPILDLEDSSNSSSSVNNTDRVDLISPGESESEAGGGRLCPACASGTCGQGLDQYGFPVIPVIVAIIVGVIWFFVFLFAWYFLIGKTGAAAKPTVGGYGYGESSQMGYGYGPSSSSHDGGDKDKDSILSILSGLTGMKGGHGRALDNLTSKITSALVELAKMYV